jgi:hypothetical protein
MGILKNDNDLTRTTIILNIIYGLTIVLFLLDNYTSFDIKSQDLKTFGYFGLLIGTALTLIWNAWIINTRNGKIIGTVIGYKKRTVEVFYLRPFFMTTSEVPKDIDQRVEWIKLYKEVNELGLKLP